MPITLTSNVQRAPQVIARPGSFAYTRVVLSGQSRGKSSYPFWILALTGMVCDLTAQSPSQVIARPGRLKTVIRL